MSTKELSRLEVMQRLKDKRLLQKEAAALLGLSIRQIKRLWQNYQKQDTKGLISKRRGQASNNRIDVSVMQKALDLTKKLGGNKKGRSLRSLPSLWRSCQRSGRSPALPYPLHE